MIRESIRFPAENKEEFPPLLGDYFNDWNDFSVKVERAYIGLKRRNLKIKPNSKDFIRILIGEEELLDLNKREIGEFIKYIEKAVAKVKDRIKDASEHWNKEAKRAGFIDKRALEEDGVEYPGNGDELRKFLKEN